MMPLSLFAIAFFSALLGVLLLTAAFIPRFRAMKMGQRILEEGPIWHAKKEGTPTMGGLAFLIAAALALLLLTPFLLREYPRDTVYPFLVTGIYIVLNGAVGILDDLTKLRHRRNEGLSPFQKLVLQTALATAYLALLKMAGVIGDGFRLPFIGELSLGFADYFVLLLLLVGVTNCANLTDGIDGLASAVAAVIFATYALLSVRTEANAPLLLAGILLAAAVAFLFYNRFPARIFMGDTGSLFLGAGAATIPLLLGRPFLSLLCGLIYVIEGASVILQVLYFKKTKRRLFLMAPIHHHFEKCGLSENRIVILFSAVTALSCLLAFFI